MKRFARIALVALTVTFLGVPLVAADLPLESSGIRIRKRITDADPLVSSRPDARVSCGSLREDSATICTDGGGWMIGDVAIGVVIIIEDYRIDALGITFQPRLVGHGLPAPSLPSMASPRSREQRPFSGSTAMASSLRRATTRSDDKSLILLASNAFLHRVNRATPVASGP